MKNLKEVMRFKSTYVTYLTFLFFIPFLLSVNAQEAVVSSGGNASGSGGSVSYSVGQVVYTTNTSTNGTVSQGVQQPYKIQVSTAIKSAGDILLQFNAYPNPTTDILKLTTSDRDIENILYQLFDMNGKLIHESKLTGPETSINMDGLSPSVYFLKIIDKNKEIKTFKIIKR